MSLVSAESLGIGFQSHTVDKKNEEQSGNTMKNDGKGVLLEEHAFSKCIKDNMSVEVK